MLEEILNGTFDELLKTLQETGKFNYEKDGLKISATLDDNTASINYTYSNNPKKDTTKAKAKDNNVRALKERFDKFVETIDNEFFYDVCDTYKMEKLEELQKFVSSDNEAEVLMGIQDFVSRIKMVAKNHIADIDEQIIALQDERKTLQDILNTKF